MPCSDGWNTPIDPRYIDDLLEEIRNARNRNDLLARMLCHTLKLVEETAPEIKKYLSQETQAWWTEHQAIDAARISKKEGAGEYWGATREK